MSKIKLTGSNSGYVEIDSAADAGNLTLTLPTSGVRLLSNTDNVFSGITTTGELDINGKIDVSTDIVRWKKSKCWWYHKSYWYQQLLVMILH